MKICSRCNTSVSDEYRYCLNCGNVLERSSSGAEEPPPTVVYQGAIATANTVPPTIPSIPLGATPSNASASSSITSGPRYSRLPWLVVVACIVTILVLVAIIAIQKKSAVTETAATIQSTEPTPTPTPTASETALSLNPNQPSPVSSVSPAEKKQASPTPTPVVSGVVSDPQLVPSVTPTPSIATPTPTPTSTPTPTPQPAVDPNRIYSNREVSERARIVSQPKPAYTDSARQNGVQGVVVLSLVLRFDGTVGSIRVVSGLPNGLSEQAIAAARNIRFTPAQKDGVPVSVSMQVEYRFSLY